LLEISIDAKNVDVGVIFNLLVFVYEDRHLSMGGMVNSTDMIIDAICRKVIDTEIF
jgi:hypothetical protein